MNWYLAKIVFRIICGDGQHTAQFDEQMRLVMATNMEEAWHKSKEIGLQEEEVFYNQKQQLVQWQFVDVAEIYAMAELEDGAEIYSQIKETDNPETYCCFIHHKASLIRKNFSPLTCQTA
jgi:hypothetical protein